MKSWLVSITLILVFSTCYYDSEEDLYGIGECVSSNMSFNNDVLPILITHCNTCHFTGSTLGGGIILDNHTSVASQGKSGALVGSIKHTNFSAMPKDLPKLDNCKIAKIEAWVTAGSPNN